MHDHPLSKTQEYEESATPPGVLASSKLRTDSSVGKFSNRVADGVPRLAFPRCYRGLCFPDGARATRSRTEGKPRLKTHLCGAATQVADHAPAEAQLVRRAIRNKRSPLVSADGSLQGRAQRARLEQGSAMTTFSGFAIARNSQAPVTA